MERVEYKGERREFKQEVLNLRDAQHFAGHAPHLAELRLKSRFSSMVRHCALVMTAELGCNHLGTYLGRRCSMIVRVLS